jgi:hypothetical protein
MAILASLCWQRSLPRAGGSVFGKIAGTTAGKQVGRNI